MNPNIKTLSVANHKILTDLVKIHFNAFKKFNLRPWNYKDFLDILNNGYKIFYYNLDNKIIGFVIVNYNLDFREIITIAVDRSYQRKKIGSILLQHIIDYGQFNKSIYIEVAKNNYQAIKFYNKFGFKLLSYRRNYYSIYSGKNKGFRIDALVMKLI